MSVLLMYNNTEGEEIAKLSLCTHSVQCFCIVLCGVIKTETCSFKDDWCLLQKGCMKSTCSFSSRCLLSKLNPTNKI